MFDADDLPLVFMFEEDVPLAGLTYSDGTQGGDEREAAVAEAVTNLVDDTEMSEVPVDEVVVSDSEYEFLPSPGDAFSSDKDFEALRQRKWRPLCKHCVIMSPAIVQQHIQVHLRMILQ